MYRRLTLYSLIFLLFTGCNQGTKQNISGEKIREYANELYNRYLFQQAVEQYKFYLTHYPVDENEQANITYRIGNIYFIIHCLSHNKMGRIFFKN